MKKCPICGNKCSDTDSRCPICNTVLPQKSTLVVNKAKGAKQIKLCSCGTENKPHALRCEKCGSFLDNVPLSTSYDTSERMNAFNVKAHVSSGETFLISDDIVLGRQYQKELWDCYTHRAAFHIHYDNDAKVVLIDDLSKNISGLLNYNHPYQMGRKTVVFTKENYL